MPEAAAEKEPSPPRTRKGLIIVNTGDGKGKTTAALGIALRASGYGLRVSMIQFIKGKWKPGEVRAAPRLAPEFELIPFGLGFTWLSDDLERDKAEAQRGWELAKEKIESGRYDIVILDELTHAINHQFVDLQDVLAALRRKGADQHVVITGRSAPKEIVDIADLVTEMKSVKHPYESGVMAQRGIDF